MRPVSPLGTEQNLLYWMRLVLERSDNGRAGVRRVRGCVDGGRSGWRWAKGGVLGVGGVLSVLNDRITDRIICVSQPTYAGHN